MPMLLNAAIQYLRKGFSITAVNSAKIPIHAWAPLQVRAMSEAEAADIFTEPDSGSGRIPPAGLAVICGAVSGRLEVIDVDSKYDLTGALWESLCSDIITHLGAEFMGALRVITTTSGGYHIYYRCPAPGRNLKLARRLSSAEELSKNPNDKVKVLIETRGEGGYVVAPPTPGYGHLQRLPVPTITDEQRTALLAICATYNEYQETVPRPPKRVGALGVDEHDYILSPWDDYNRRGDAEALLMEHGWKFRYSKNGRNYYLRPGKDKGPASGDWWPEKGYFAVFTSSTEFETNTAYNAAGVFCVLKAGGDWKLCRRLLIEAGYGRRHPKVDPGVRKIARAHYREGRDGIIAALQDEGLSMQEAEDVADSMGPRLGTFWDFSSKGKLIISLGRFADYLESIGTFIYYPDKNSHQFSYVRQEGKIIDVVMRQHIKALLNDYLEQLPERFDMGVTPVQLRDTVYDKAAAMFGEQLLEFLPNRRPVLLKDTADRAHFPFKNGIVTVTANEVSIKDYDQIDGLVWRKSVISRSVSIMAPGELIDCEFLKFLICISGEHGMDGGFGVKTEYAMRVFGYLLHRYKDPARPWAVVLAEETEQQEDGGGTGKGLFVKALAEMINVASIDGKNFDRKDQFAMQVVSPDTNLIAIEDCQPKMDFEAHYGDITEGVTIEKKFSQSYRLPYSDAPKILFSTNYEPPSGGKHTQRRLRTLEFSPFFGVDYTPEQLFGHKLFLDWSQDEWGRFYNFCFLCVQEYLSHGLKEKELSESIKNKIIHQRFTSSFADWLEDFLAVEENLEMAHRASVLYDRFLESAGYTQRDYTNMRFSKAMMFSCPLLGYKIEQKQIGPLRQRHFEISNALK